MTAARALVLFLVLAVAGGAAAGETPAPVPPAPPPAWVVLAPAAWREELAPLAARREGEGFAVTFLALEDVPRAGTDLAADDLAAFFSGRAELSGPGPVFLLLVGTTDLVPAGRRPRARWDEEHDPELASDQAFADRDGDDRPDFPVGRLPVGDRRQLAAAVDKILAFERAPPGTSDLRLELFFGNPEFSPALNSLAETFAWQVVGSRLPERFRLRAIYGSESSVFCPPPDEFAARLAAGLNRGPALALFVGHGDDEYLHGIFWADRLNGFRPADLARLDPAARPGPLYILACRCGSYDRPGRPSIAEQLFNAPGGPVAVAAASRTSHPLPNALTAELLALGLGQGYRRLGELDLALRRAVADRVHPFLELALGRFSPGDQPPPPAARLRADQVFLYNLFGDPATRLRFPAGVALTVDQISPRSVTVRFPAPGPGRGYVALLPSLAAPPAPPPPGSLPDPGADPAAWRRALTDRLAAANRREFARAELAVDGAGEQWATLAWPADLAPGGYRVLVYLAGDDFSVAGATAFTFAVEAPDETAP